MMGLKQFGRRCRFHYPPVIKECPNCIRGGSGMSQGIYRIGGEEPFDEGMTCPVCLGKGTFEETKTEEDILIVLFDPKQWFSPGKVANMPDNTIMVIGDRLRTWGKVVSCERMIPNLDVYNDNIPYRLFGEPLPIGLFNGDGKSGSAWFSALFSREGGG